MNKFILILLAILLPIFTQAQFCVGLHGHITDYFSGEGMKGVEVRAKDSRGTVSEGYTKRSGFYAFELDSGEVYNIEVRKEDMVSKRIIIDTRKAVCPDTMYYDMDLQITMFKRIDSLDLSAFNIPIGICKYDPSVRNMSWDNPYTNKLSSILTRVMWEYEKSVMGYYERKDEVSGMSFEALMDTVKEMTINGNIMVLESDIDSSMIIRRNYNDSEGITETESTYGLFFTVQVGVYSTSKDLKNLYDIDYLNSEFISNSQIRYTSGQFRGIKLASSYREKLVEKGIKDAFVTAYYDGKRITLKEANDLIDTRGPEIILPQ